MQPLLDHFDPVVRDAMLATARNDMPTVIRLIDTLLE
jgi:hypothetical protein